MDGEDDHVRLLVEYPPKVAVSNLVNSLKGVSSRLPAQGTTGHPEALLERRPVVAFLFRLILRRRSDLHRAPVHRAATDATLKPQDGDAARAILTNPDALYGHAKRRRGLSRTRSIRYLAIRQQG